MFDKDKLIVPKPPSEDDNEKRIAAEREKQAKEQFEAEVASYTSYVLGKDGLKPNRLGGRAGETVEQRLDALEQYAADTDRYCASFEDTLKRFIRHNVRHMRGIALQAVHVNENTLKAANLASEASNGVQKMCEVHGGRQVALNQAMVDVNATLEALIEDATKHTDLVIENELDPDSAAAPNLDAVNQDFLDAETRLIRRAQAAGKLSDEQVTEMLARTTALHGNALAEKASKPNKKYTELLVKGGFKH